MRKTQRKVKRTTRVKTTRVTSAGIAVAIEQMTGYAGAQVHCADGMCHFWSDNERTNELIYSHDQNGVYVCRLGHLNLEQWVNEFKYLFKVEEVVMNNDRCVPQSIAEACGIKFSNLEVRKELYTPDGSGTTSSWEYVVTNKDNGHNLFRSADEAKANAFKEQYNV